VPAAPRFHRKWPRRSSPTRAKNWSSTPATEAPSLAIVAAGQATTWSDLITAEAVEDEIKSRQTQLAVAVENATRFKSGQYQQAQVELGVLATMLAIVAQFDGEIRWKNEAAGLRDLIARAALHCKTANDATYQEASARAQDLQSLIRGGVLSIEKADSQVEWSRVADRNLLMKRLDQAEQNSLGPDLANAQTFARSADKLLHEAQIVAALAQVIAQPGYEFADDETYVEYAQQMREKSLSLRSAVQEGNYEAARRAAGELRQSCTDCHEGYRS
jgi:hypothetical protein